MEIQKWKSDGAPSDVKKLPDHSPSSLGLLKVSRIEFKDQSLSVHFVTKWWIGIIQVLCYPFLAVSRPPPPSIIQSLYFGLPPTHPHLQKGYRNTWTAQPENSILIAISNRMKTTIVKLQNLIFKSVLVFYDHIRNKNNLVQQPYAVPTHTAVFYVSHY